MWYLAIYDIAEPRRLNRVAKILKDYGTRVQKSKFEIEVSDKTFLELCQRIEEKIDPAEDGVKYIPLCQTCRQKTEIIGQGSFIDPEQAFMVL